MNGQWIEWQHYSTCGCLASTIGQPLQREQGLFLEKCWHHWLHLYISIHEGYPEVCSSSWENFISKVKTPRYCLLRPPRTDFRDKSCDLEKTMWWGTQKAKPTQPKSTQLYPTQPKLALTVTHLLTAADILSFFTNSSGLKENLHIWTEKN